MVKTITIVFAVVLVINACKHEPYLPPCIAGTGGNVTIVVYASHGNGTLQIHVTHPDTTFVKFGTTSYPGNNPAVYDTLYVGEPGEDHIHCFGLNCGDYFVYRTAWDSVQNLRRYGGSGISISETSGEQSLIVEVN